jgi:purine nucleoside phosphorylase
VLASAACGSLREEIKPGELVLFGSFIDRYLQLHIGQYVCE